MSADAIAIHREAPPVDLHADSLLWSRLVGYDLQKHHTPPLPRARFGGHVDIPRLHEAGAGGQFFGLVSAPLLTPRVDEETLQQLRVLHDAARSSQGSLRIAVRAEDLDEAAAGGWTAALVGMEGAHGLGTNLDTIQRFAALGLRYMGVVHLFANRFGRPAYGWGSNASEGLTRIGFELVERCESAGVLVDLSHLNAKGFTDAIAKSRKPVIVSHAGVAGVHPSKRNVLDAQLRSVAERGGVVGVMFCPFFLGRDGLDAVVDHLAHIVRVAGENTPALGSDWDGFIRPTEGLREPQDLPRLTEAMLRRGMPVRIIKKILRENVLRVLRDVPPAVALRSSTRWG